LKRKKLLFGMAALVLCLSFSVTAVALNLSPKDLVLKSVDNLDLSYQEAFLEKTSGTMVYEISKFESGTLDDLAFDLSILRGAKLEADYKLDVPGKKAFVDTKLTLSNKTHQGQLYLVDDQLILTKSFLLAISELVPESGIEELGELPDYLFGTLEDMGMMWGSLQDFQFAGLSETYGDFIKFFLEAIPAEYFSANLSAVTLELDHAKFEETLFRFSEKIKNETERFADILVDITYASDIDGALAELVPPQEMKDAFMEEIASAVEDGSWFTREDIGMIGEFVQVNIIKYEASILPGGKGVFEASFAFQPGSGISGGLDFVVETVGKADDRSIVYSCELNVSEPFMGIDLAALFKGDYTLKGGLMTQNVVFACTSEGWADFSIELTGKSTQKVDPNVKITPPLLTEANSLDISDLLVFPSYGYNFDFDFDETTVVFEEGEWEGFIQEERLMLPARFIGDAIGAEVVWREPNQIIISKDYWVLTLFVNEEDCLLNNHSLTADLAPVIVDGKAYVPARFVVEALWCEIDLVGKSLYFSYYEYAFPDYDES